MKIDAISWLISLLVLIVASTQIKFVQTYRPNFQPKGAVFSIWWIIFASLAFSGAYLFTEEREFLIPTLLVCISILSCVAWTRVNGTPLAIWSMWTAWVFAILGTTTLFNQPLVRIGPSLLSGWLTVALALQVTIHLHEFENIEEQFWFPIPFLALNILASTLLNAPLIAAPLLWTVLFSTTWKNAIAFGVSGIIGVSFPLLLNSMHNFW